MSQYFMGIDIGTYEAKGMIMDGDGRCLATHSVSHKMETPQPGFAEHDAEKAWWGGFCTISKALLAKTSIDPKLIAGVGCSAIGPCCLPVDSQCRPLRPAILYGVDVRAAEEIDELNQELGEEYILKTYGNPITSQSVGPKILWLKKHEPEVYKNAAKFITASTYLVAKLTGKYTVDNYTAAYFTPMYDLSTCDWDYKNLERICPAEKLAECHWTDEIAGGVNEKAASETGLAVGTPVTVGTADASADAVGVGICRPGDMLLMFGSSIFIIHVVPKLTSDPRYWSGPYLFRDTYMVSSGMSTAGTLTRWFRDNLAPDYLQQEQQGGKNAYEALMGDISDIPPGSEGLITLPYFSGERTPINDPAARGMIFGLNLNHTRAHLYQSCLEGVGYGIAQHLKGYGEIGMKTERIVAVGGGTKNPKWMQIVSDISGRELTLGQVFGAAFGDALIAAMAVGHFSSMEEATRKIEFSGSVTPNLENTAKYAPYLKRYTELYSQTKELMHGLK
ncbi:MAG: FGGY-family carbohydrate kinase [Oscillospiraceae bacterium]